MNLSSLHWIYKCLILAGGFCLFPILLTSLNQRGTRPEVTLAVWCLGVAIGIYACAACGGLGIISADTSNYTKPIANLVIALILGATAGMVMNTMYAQAVHSAPNPALALSVINSSAVFAFVLAPLLHWIKPAMFEKATMSWSGFGGTILIILGIVLIAKK